MEPKAMAPSTSAKWRTGPGNGAKMGWSRGRGITRPARSEAEEGRGNPRDHQAEPRSGGDGQALAPGGRNRPRTTQSTRRHRRLISGYGRALDL